MHVQRTVTLVAALLATIIGCGAINWFGNAMGLYPSSHRPSHFERSWKVRRLQEALGSNRRPQTLVLGSSRVMGIAPAQIEAITGEPAFNLGVSAGKPIDSLAILEYCLDLGLQPQRVIWGLEQGALVGGMTEYQTQLFSHAGLFGAVPFPERAQIAFHAWKATNLGTTAGSLLNLWRPPSLAPQPLGDTQALLLDDGYLIYPARTLALGAKSTLNEQRRFAEQDETARESTFAGAGQNGPFDGRQMDLVRQLLGRCSRAGIRAAVFVPPTRSKQLASVAAADLDDSAAFVDRLRDVCEEFGAAFHDFRLVAAYGGDPDDFWDDVHQRPDNLRRMTNALLGVAPATEYASVPRDAEILERLPPRTSRSLP